MYNIKNKISNKSTWSGYPLQVLILLVLMHNKDIYHFCSKPFNLLQ
nr:MAG TPA: hypothetical protein [Caudoviricetes sp.]